MSRLTHIVIQVACALFVVSTGLAEHPFLSATSEPIRFTGTHWNDEWSGDSPLAVDAKITSLAKTDAGELLRIQFSPVGTPKHPRKLSPLTFWVAAQGAIFRIAEDADAAPPAPTALGLSELLLPAVDEAGCFSGTPPAADGATLAVADRGWRWVAQPWTTEIGIDHGYTVRFLATHPSGHFTKFVWQKGIGLNEISVGSGARQDGWSLQRTVGPVGKAAASAGADVASLFATLPAEFIPHTETLRDIHRIESRAAFTKVKTGTLLPAINARVEVDRANGWMSISSQTDGEGETLEAGLWKRKDGSQLVVLLLQGWSSGPTHTKALSAIEIRDGTFRHGTTTVLPMPTDADFYIPEAAEKRPPAGLIAGAWSLPRTGTTITIRPGDEEGMDLMPESVTSTENHFFELLWDGASFRSVKLPRVIPPAAYEPKEWVFQCTEPAPSALFLKRQGDRLQGELRSPGKALPVSGEIDPLGEEIALKIGNQKARKARLTRDGESGDLWNTLVFALSPDSEADGATDMISYAPVASSVESRSLPRYRILGEDNVFYPQFDAKESDWKAINAKVLDIIQQERKSFATASKGIAKDEASLGISFTVVSVRQNTCSLVFTVNRYVGGAHGQSNRIALNYDFKTHRFLKFEDLFNPKSDWQKTIANLVDQGFIKKGDREEDQSLVLTSQVPELAWALLPPHDIEISIAPESLAPSSPEGVFRLTYQSLNEAGILRKGGALDPE